MYIMCVHFLHMNIESRFMPLAVAQKLLATSVNTVTRVGLDVQQWAQKHRQ